MTLHEFRQSERGFTLLEVLVTIIIMGIVFAIASSTWFGLVENREVVSATNQFAADMRLAHTSANNRLGTAKVVFSYAGDPVTCGGVSTDYCLVKPVGVGTQSIPRSLPGDTVANSPNLLTTVGLAGTTTAIEFYANGTAKALGPSGATGVTDRCPAGTPSGVPRIQIASSDGDPAHCITFNPATSRIEID